MKRYVKASIGGAYKIAELEVESVQGWPTPATTGSSGALNVYSGSQDVTNGRFTNVHFKQPMRFYGTLELRNCKFDSWGLAQRCTSVNMEDVDARAWSISSCQNVFMNRIELFGSSGDLLHITSDAGTMCNNITITNSCFHSPKPGAGAHLDGVQVRGVNWLTFRNNYISVGPWVTVSGQDVLNAAVFLENANGDNRNVTLERNYLDGGGYIFRAGTGGHTNLKIIDNVFGPNGKYGAAYLNNVRPLKCYGNVMESGGPVQGLPVVN